MHDKLRKSNTGEKVFQVAQRINLSKHSEVGIVMQASVQERCMQVRNRYTMYRLLKRCNDFPSYASLRFIRPGDSLTNKPTIRKIIAHVHSPATKKHTMRPMAPTRFLVLVCLLKRKQ